MAPPTPYMLFCNANRDAARQKLVAEGHAKIPVTVVAKELGQMWKALSDEERASFRTQAEELLKQWKEEQQEQAGEGQEQPEAPSAAQLPAVLPPSWVRRVVGLDPEINRCSGEALKALSAVADVFLAAMCAKATAAAVGSKRRTVRIEDIERSVRQDKRLVSVGLPAVLTMVSAMAPAGEDAKPGPPGKKPKVDKPAAGAKHNSIQRAFGLV